MILCCAGQAICLASDGSEVWRTDVGAFIKASPVVVHATEQVAVFTVDGRCLFLDSRTGRLLHESSLGLKITASPALSGDILAVGLQRDIAVGINVHDYRRVWVSEAGSPGSYTSFTVLPDGNFICTAEFGNIICLRANDGSFLWESSQVLGLPNHNPAMHVTPVAAPDGTMYCASYDGDLYCFKFRPREAGTEQ
jgi:outer membrane protein assembly factor BamB